ncbi:MAG TPA: DUF4189 domain-containing protein [Sphingopyxis sp.]|jgi:hypothetical protein|uniref:DUF4189 domain-containing protein n=1 Tax=Sphingopyxis sp. TaxID=1908224 RepID=UPI002E122DF0|nr:DUF4189 domain-containing protein [Sphingopyxis sp.]
MKLFLGLATLVLPATLVAAAFILPGTAAAQQRCHGGPLPNQIIIGYAQDGTPLCAPNPNAGAPPPTPRPVVNTFAAIAWHPDADDVWLSGNYDGPNAAPGDALAACNRDMGGGCTSIGEWHNSSMAIIRNRYGELFSAWAGDGGRTRKQVLADCSAKQPLPCEVVGTFASGKRDHRPNLATARKLYAAVAWVKGTDGYDNRLYIARGHPRLADAEREALAACTKGAGRPCDLLAYVGNGFIQTFWTGTQGNSATPETSAKRAAQAAEARCKLLKQPCRLQAAYDSRTPGLVVHDFLAASR